MPLEAEDGADEADGEGLTKQWGEHERNGGEEPRGGADLGVPAPVERRARGGGERQHCPERRPQPRVPNGGQMPQVVDAHVRRGGQRQAAQRDGSPETACPAPRGRRPLRIRLRLRHHLKVWGDRASPRLAILIGNSELMIAINSRCVNIEVTRISSWTIF